MNNASQPNETTKKTQSHVTTAPATMPGENYDPQIRSQYANEPEVVHAKRSPETAELSISPENQKRCEESAAKFPHLNLSKGEYVILDVRRHPIGMFLPVFATGAGLLGLMAVLIFYPNDSASGMMAALPTYEQIVLPVLLVMVLVALGGAVALWVYLQNHFYMTNESVIQEIQHGLFDRNEQTVSLGSIEDASFKQTGILQTMLNYGTVRLSTEGDETTYRFSYVANPRRHVSILNNAIEAFKNGRPVDPYES